MKRWLVRLSRVNTDGDDLGYVHEFYMTRRRAERRVNEWNTDGVLIIPSEKFAEGFCIEPHGVFDGIEEACEYWRSLI